MGLEPHAQAGMGKESPDHQQDPESPIVFQKAQVRVKQEKGYQACFKSRGRSPIPTATAWRHYFKLRAHCLAQSPAAFSSTVPSSLSLSQEHRHTPACHSTGNAADIFTLGKPPLHIPMQTQGRHLAAG